MLVVKLSNHIYCRFFPWWPTQHSARYPACVTALFQICERTVWWTDWRHKQCLCLALIARLESFVQQLEGFRKLRSFCLLFSSLYIYIYIYSILYIYVYLYIYRGSGCHVMQRLFQDVQQMSDFCKVSWVSKQPAMQNDWPPTSTADRCGDSMP